MQKYILSLDAGTTNCRSVLVDQNGSIYGMAQKEFSQIFPKSGWVEHDPEEIWSTQFETIEKVLEQNNISPNQIAGIGISNQRETSIIWNKTTGEALHNAIVWQDKRTVEYCEKLKKSEFADYIQSNTGLVIDAYFSATKILWLLDHLEKINPDLDHEQLAFGTVDSWLIWKLTQGSSHLTDHSNASRTMIYNIKRLEWDTKILEHLGIPSTILPEVKNSADQYGYFEYKGVQIPICGVAGDQQAALFGQACFYPGLAKNTYGTGCFMLLNIGQEPIASKNGLLTTVCCDPYGKAAYALEGSVFIAGAAVQWLRDGLKIIKTSEETEYIARQVKEENDVVVVPAFAGLGAPYWDMYARGAIFGLTRDTSQAELVKATLDAIAFQSKDVIAAMQKDSGKTLKILKVDGGASNNNYIMQFQADILGIPVERPECTESTALGAAFLAGIQLGIWDHKAIVQQRKIAEVFSPKINPEDGHKLYKRWLKAVDKARNWVDNA